VPITPSGGGGSDVVTSAELDAHLAETDPSVHTAAKVDSASTVGQGDVEADLDWLHANTAANTITNGYSSSFSTVNKNTTTAEEDLISFTLAGGALSDEDMLVVECSGDILANSGSPTFTWKFKNDTNVLDTPAAAMTTSANDRRWKLRAVIRRTSSSSQSISANLQISQAIATTDWNLVDTSHDWVGNRVDISTTDFTAASTISFTVQMSVSNANNRVRMYGYNAYIVKGD
jgi:hypothetical protein